MSANVYGESTRTPKAVASLPSGSISIYMAGDVVHAKQIIRKFCREMPSCVTLVSADYLYTGGEEAGVIVTFRVYPRFPESAGLLKTKANFLAELLRKQLSQRSYMVDDGTTTTWVSDKEVE